MSRNPTCRRKKQHPTLVGSRCVFYFHTDGATGCHTRPWDNAPVEIKNIFHHYESKDTGCLFHQKLIMAYNPRDPKAAPYYVYIGSANLSQSAWGALEQDKKSNEATCNTKLGKMSNFKCGVVVPGAMIKGLLETGTEDWHVIVPYVQDGKRYDLKKDRPWNGICPKFGFLFLLWASEC